MYSNRKLWEILKSKASIVFSLHNSYSKLHVKTLKPLSNTLQQTFCGHLGGYNIQTRFLDDCVSSYIYVQYIKIPHVWLQNIKHL